MDTKDYNKQTAISWSEEFTEKDARIIVMIGVKQNGEIISSIAPSDRLDLTAKAIRDVAQQLEIHTGNTNKG